MADGEEAKLVERLRRQDERAFNEIVRLYQGRVYHIARAMLHDDAEAEDVAQEVFVTVFKNISKFRGDSKLSTWIHRITTNHSLNRLKFLKRRGRGAKREFDELALRDAAESATMNNATHLPRPDHMIEGRQMEAMIQRALAELSEEQKTLVILRDIENMSYEEIRDITGLAAGTVKSRLHRARQALQRRVLELEGGAR